MTQRILELIAGDEALLKSVEASLDLNSLIVVRTPSVTATGPISEAFRRRLETFGIDPLRIHSRDQQSLFEAFKPLVDLSPFFLTNLEEQSALSEDELISRWSEFGLSHYHYRIYCAYSALLSALLNHSSKQSSTILVLSGFSFDDVITQNLITNLAKDWLNRANQSAKIVLFVGEDEDSLRASKEIVSISNATGITSSSIDLPMPSESTLRSALAASAGLERTADSVYFKALKDLTENQVSRFNQKYLEIIQKGSGLTQGETSSSVRSLSDLIGTLQPDRFFSIASEKLRSGDALSIFELTRIIDFTYFYEYSTLVENLRELIAHPSPLVRFALLKAVHVYGKDRASKAENIAKSMEALSAWVKTKSNEYFCEDVFFTFTRCKDLASHPLTIAIRDQYYEHLRERSHPQFDFLTDFFEFGSEDDEKITRQLEHYFDRDRPTGYNFIVKRNSRFISWATTAVAHHALEYQFGEYTEELTYLEEKINSLTSPISNILIAKSNLAEEYVKSHKFQNAKEIYSVITTVPKSMQMASPAIFAEGSISDLLISSGVALPNLDESRLINYALQTPLSNTKALFWINAILSGTTFAHSDVTALLKNFEDDNKASSEGNVSSKLWMLVPFIMWQAELAGVSHRKRENLYAQCRSAIKIQSVEELLAELSLSKSKQDASDKITRLLKSDIVKPGFMTQRRIFAISIVCHFAEKFKLYIEDLLIAASSEFYHLTYKSWRQTSTASEIISSSIAPPVLSYISNFHTSSPEVKSKLLSGLSLVEESIDDPVLHASFFATSLLTLSSSSSVQIRLFYKIHNSVTKSLEVKSVWKQNRVVTSCVQSSESGAINSLTGRGFDFTVRGTTAKIQNTQRTIEIQIDGRDCMSADQFHETIEYLVKNSTFIDLCGKSHEQFAFEFANQRRFESMAEQLRINHSRHLEALESNRKRLTTLLSGLNAAVCVISDHDLNLGEQVSQQFRDRFLSDSNSSNFREQVLDRANLRLDQKASIVSAIISAFGEAEYIFHANSDLLPNELIFGDVIYEITWNCNTNDDGLVTEIFVVMTDVSESRARKAREDLSMKEAQIIAVLNRLKPQEIETLFATISQHMHLVEKAKPSEGKLTHEMRESILRDVHTLKAVARSNGFTQLADEIHIAEDLLRNQANDSLLKQTTYSLKRSVNQIESVYNRIFRRSQLTENRAETMNHELIDLFRKKGLGSDTDLLNVLHRFDRYNLKHVIRSEVEKSAGSCATPDRVEPLVVVDCPDDQLTDARTQIALSVILAHLSANSMIHGIEPELERQSQGKPVQGLIRVEVESSESGLEITYSDDGRGLNLAKLRRINADLGKVAESEFEIARLIFVSGISTLSSADVRSGRGVGMNAAKNEIERLGGQVTLSLDSGGGGDFRPFTIKMTIPKSSKLLLVPKVSA